MEALIKSAIHTFQELITPEVYAKGELIHRQDETSKSLYIVESGLLRSFYIKDGKDITAHFAKEYTIIGAVDSIVRNKKSIYNIEALENSRVLKINNLELEGYLEEHPTFERIARQISQEIYFDLVERMEGLTFLTAKERYDHLLSKHPNIVHRVNLGHISSYLGITQETLSRVRKM